MSAPFWLLDPAVDFLNHGSFGSCPAPVLEAQTSLRERLEREPVRFLVRELPGLAQRAREALGEFVGADPDDLAFVPNATAAVATVLRSLSLEPGDELLTTDHAYNACRNALAFAAQRSGARLVVAHVPFPLESEAQVVEAVLARATARTRLALVDHVTSPTALVLPVRPVVEALQARGIDVLVDGAHAPGMIDLDIRSLGAAYYTGNCHKWVCAPKGAAFLHARKDRQGSLHPLSISHGYTAPLRGRSRFRVEADWTGTHDPTPFLSIPAALRALSSLAPGGLAEVRARNRALALQARALLAAALQVPRPCPDSMIGSMASLPLPDAPAGHEPGAEGIEPLQEKLWQQGIEVPVLAWPARPRRLVRVSAQQYNSPAQYERLARSLVEALRAEG